MLRHRETAAEWPVLAQGHTISAPRDFEISSASKNHVDDTYKNIEVDQQYLSEEIAGLPEETMLLLAGWCRLGQQGDSNVWVKVFCILYALAVVPDQPSKGLSDRG